MRGVFSIKSPGWLAFQFGLFLLPSSALLAGVCLFVTCVAGSRNRAEVPLNDPWMRPLLLAAVLMLIGAILADDAGLAWAGLANWIPFFWGFWAFRPFLLTASRRQRAARCLLAGTVPVLITGFGQMQLGWTGPWQLFGGGIIWFLAPGGQPEGRLSGLFDYANIAGAWLAVVWSFALAAVLARRDPPGVVLWHSCWPRRSSRPWCSPVPGTPWRPCHSPCPGCSDPPSGGGCFPVSSGLGTAVAGRVAWGACSDPAVG